MKRNKRIVFIYPTRNELFVKPINYLADHSDHDVYYVFESDYKPKEFSKRVHFVNRLRKDFGLNWLNQKLPFQVPVPVAYKKLYSKLKELKPDIVVAMDLNALYFWQMLFYKTTLGCKLILATEFKEHSSQFLYRNVGRMILLLLKAYKSRIDGVLCFTKNAYEFWKKQGYDATLLPASIDTTRFTPKKTYNKVPRLLCIARMVPFKNHNDLLDAYEQLPQKFPLTLVGDGVLYDHIRKRSLLLGVDVIKRIESKDMPKLYRNHDILILPSSNEAIGMVIPEAMACGLATITSNTVGANTYVREGETGYIFKEHNVGALKGVIQRTSSVASTLGKKGASHIKTFDDKKVGELYVSYFNQLCK